MKNLFSLLATLLLASCEHKYEDTAKQQELFKAFEKEPLDTLICDFKVNTGSQDLYILQGKLTLSSNVEQQLSDPSTSDIKICGKFPKDMTDVTSLNFNPDHVFKIIGRTISAETDGPSVKVPLFYVSEWDKFKFDYDKWVKKGDLGSYPYRKNMVDDILEHLKFKGESLANIESILGKPDFYDASKISYTIETDYGSDIDPTETTALVIEFNKDNVVTRVKKEE
ncbi:hypothetical protein NAT51_08185 [Flavobacterium amniphilum]|uniref:hypothetical protein n=1 Tax=Flavobacterium amniphilum TaxID=1834035 RepID=UPI00202A0B3F|nr:hypothetical protein [Flavobacterium amniphilum]MCL9805497.1 hypothetical protein [Flavobacterium amniphilum]